MELFRLIAYYQIVWVKAHLLSTFKQKRLVMKVSKVINCFIDYHRMNSKKSTLRNYGFVMDKFLKEFSDREIESITHEDVHAFMIRHTQHAKQSTKKLRYSTLCSFFNFTKNTMDKNLQNPCDTNILRKMFRAPKKPIGKSLKRK